MITQAIKRWFLKVFAWWPRNKSQEVPYTPVDKRANAALASDDIPHTAITGLTPQPGVAPLIAGNAQSEATCSTIDDLPDHTLSPSASPGENRSLLPAASPPGLPVEYKPDMAARRSEGSVTGDAPLKPTPEQHLDFLHYLVRRGIVNEGFSEGQTPAQYQRD